MLPLLVIALIGGAFVYLLISEKITMCGPFTTYVMLTLLPIILAVVVPIFILSIISITTEKKLIALPYLIICLEILISTIFIFIKINVLPGSDIDKLYGKSNHLSTLASGKRLLKYSIYGNSLYLLSALVMITYWAIVNHELLLMILADPLGSLIGLVLVVLLMIAAPFMVITIYIQIILGVIIITNLTILFILLIIISMNGALRILYRSQVKKKHSIVYLIFLIIPVVNIICLFHFYNLTKSELQNLYVC